MPVADATLENANVNGGTAVKLGADRITYSWKNMTKDNAVSNKYDISEVTYSGFENPTITIQGTIPIDIAPTNHITQGLLVDFATVKAGNVLLTVTAGKTGGTNLKGRPAAGYQTSGTTSTIMQNNLNVTITGFNISFAAAETREGEGWGYTLNLIETI